VFLLRQAANPNRTAAPVRLIVSSRGRTARHHRGPLAGSIGRPVFTVTHPARAAGRLDNSHWSGNPMNAI